VWQAFANHVDVIADSVLVETQNPCAERNQREGNLVRNVGQEAFFVKDINEKTFLRNAIDRQRSSSTVGFRGAAAACPELPTNP